MERNDNWHNLVKDFSSVSVGKDKAAELADDLHFLKDCTTGQNTISDKKHELYNTSITT